MNQLWRKLVKPREKFTPIEKMILEKVKILLPKQAADVFELQISLINKIQRHDKGREVNMYSVRNGVSVFPKEALFPNQDEELELARLRLQDPASGHGSRVSVYLVSGRLFSLEFSLPPDDLAKATLSNIEIEHLVNPLLAENKPESSP